MKVQSPAEENAEMFLFTKELQAELAIKSRELEWANGYITRLETRIVELHKFIDEKRRTKVLE